MSTFNLRTVSMDYQEMHAFSHPPVDIYYLGGGPVYQTGFSKPKTKVRAYRFNNGRSKS